MAGGVPSLQERCIAEISSWLSLRSVLALLQFAEEDEILKPYALRHIAAAFVRDRFDALCALEGEEVVRAALPPALWEELCREAERRRQELRVFRSRKGRVVERPPPEGAPGASGAAVAEGVTPDGVRCFPISSLVAGVAWPRGVVAAHRERHLSEADFAAVLGVSRPDFAALPQWKQQRLKMQKQLF